MRILENPKSSTDARVYDEGNARVLVDQMKAPGEGEPERMSWLDTTPFLLNMLALALLIYALSSGDTP